ncbi:MAG TPA: AsmA-like C-terminal region-containing protein, partial [Hyphomicrobium sp.]|nr:AsmA-like C-terminal region-containing protein [Hyphomicrobium sp.]
EGKMLADIAELEFDDGTRGSGQIRVDMSGANPHYGLQVKFEAADVGHAIHAVFGHPAVQGRGALTADLTASGNTGDMLLRSLAGKLSVSLAEAGRVGLDINKLTAPASEPLDSAAWQNASTRAIAVDKLDARFTVAKGILRAQSAGAVSGERALKAEGTIDLIARDLDLEFAVSDAPKAATGAIPIETGSVIAPGTPRNTIGVHGPWSAPTVRSGISAGEAPTYGPPSPG